MFVHPEKMFGISGDRFKMFINDSFVENTYLFKDVEITKN